MRGELFPISKISRNEIINIEGKISKFYKLNSVDLEQYDYIELQKLFSDLSVSLNNLESSKFFKFYKLGAGNYLKPMRKLIIFQLS